MTEQKYTDEDLNVSDVKLVLLHGCDTWTVTSQITNKLQTFVNRCLRRITGTRWPKIISNTELCGAAGKKPIILRTDMTKWRRIGHTLRKGKESIKNTH